MLKFIKLTPEIITLIAENSLKISDYFSFNTYWVHTNIIYPENRINYNGKELSTFAHQLANPALHLPDFVTIEEFNLFHQEGENNLALQLNSFDELAAFCDAFTNNTRIEKLALQINFFPTICDNQDAYLAEIISYKAKRLHLISQFADLAGKSRLKELYIEIVGYYSYYLTTEEIGYLCTGLAKNKHLRNLALPHAIVDENAALAITTLLQQHKGLEKFSCRYASFKGNAAKILDEYFLKKGKLTHYLISLVTPDKLANKLSNIREKHVHTYAFKLLLLLKVQQRLDDSISSLLTIDYSTLANLTLSTMDKYTLLNTRTINQPFFHIKTFAQLQEEIHYFLTILTAMENFLTLHVNESVIQYVEESQPQFNKQDTLDKIHLTQQLLTLLTNIITMSITAEKNFDNKKTLLTVLWQEIQQFTCLTPQQQVDTLTNFHQGMRKQLQHFTAPPKRSIFRNDGISLLELSIKEYCTTLESELKTISNKYKQFIALHQSITATLKQAEALENPTQNELIALQIELENVHLALTKSKDSLVQHSKKLRLASQQIPALVQEIMDIYAADSDTITQQLLKLKTATQSLFHSQM